MTTSPENSSGESLPFNPEDIAPEFISTLGASPRPTEVKAWPPGKPPGGRLPPGPTAQDKGASPSDKPAK